MNAVTTADSTSQRTVRAATRLMVGTAQLGMRYGVANRVGQPDAIAAEALIAAAYKQGFNAFDTAEVYGESEAVLGRAFERLGIASQVEVVTKGKLDAASGATLMARVSASRRKLGVQRVSAWLLHDEKQLGAWTNEVASAATMLRNEGAVGSFGVSVYTPDCALRALEQLGLRALQFPASPFDRRFLRQPTLARIAASGSHVYVRSVYLQGLCLMPLSEVPANVPHGRIAVSALREFCGRHDVALDHFCLHYVLQRTASLGARIVVGLESREQLDRNAALLAAEPLPTELLDAWDAVWPDDLEDLILPYRWNANR